ncbi:MAG: carbohydrate ABC transporter substrate-binding protein, partial [Anaerolineae bacterium]|nr:carbohydrate ABC transporter substrate-binding protein [Anaerolineae bacterium]
DNPHADAFLKLNEGRGQDVRWAWDGLLDGEPNGYDLMQNNAISVLNGEISAQEAADNLQNGLAEWLPAAQTCAE